MKKKILPNVQENMVFMRATQKLRNEVSYVLYKMQFIIENIKNKT